MAGSLFKWKPVCFANEDAGPQGESYGASQCFETQIWTFGGVCANGMASSELHYLDVRAYASEASLGSEQENTDTVEWVKLPSAGTKPRRAAFASAVLLRTSADEYRENAIYYYGGRDGQTTLYNLFMIRLDRARPTWVRPKVTGSAPPARSRHTAIAFRYTDPAVVTIEDTECTDHNAMVLFGGSANADDSYLLNDVYIFVPEVNKWIAIPEPKGKAPCGRFGHTATLVQGAMYVFGGCGDRGCLNDLYRFDLKEFEWSEITCTGGLTSTAAMPAKRMDHAATAIKDRYLLIHGGGGADGTVYNTIHLLDLETHTWTQPAVQGENLFSPAKRGHAMHLVGDTILLFGGRSSLSFAQRGQTFVSALECDLSKLEAASEASAAHTSPPTISISGSGDSGCVPVSPEHRESSGGATRPMKILHAKTDFLRAASSERLSTSMPEFEVLGATSDSVEIPDLDDADAQGNAQDASAQDSSAKTLAVDGRSRETERTPKGVGFEKPLKKAWSKATWSPGRASRVDRSTSVGGITRPKLRAGASMDSNQITSLLGGSARLGSRLATKEEQQKKRLSITAMPDANTRQQSAVPPTVRGERDSVAPEKRVPLQDLTPPSPDVQPSTPPRDDGSEGEERGEDEGKNASERTQREHSRTTLKVDIPFQLQIQTVIQDAPERWSGSRSQVRRPYKEILAEVSNEVCNLEERVAKARDLKETARQDNGVLREELNKMRSMIGKMRSEMDEMKEELRKVNMLDTSTPEVLSPRRRITLDQISQMGWIKCKAPEWNMFYFLIVDNPPALMAFPDNDPSLRPVFELDLSQVVCVQRCAVEEPPVFRSIAMGASTSALYKMQINEDCCFSITSTAGDYVVLCAEDEETLFEWLRAMTQIMYRPGVLAPPPRSSASALNPSGGCADEEIGLKSPKFPKKSKQRRNNTMKTSFNKLLVKKRPDSALPG